MVVGAVGGEFLGQLFVEEVQKFMVLEGNLFLLLVHCGLGLYRFVNFVAGKRMNFDSIFPR